MLPCISCETLVWAPIHVIVVEKPQIICKTIIAQAHGMTGNNRGTTTAIPAKAIITGGHPAYPAARRHVLRTIIRAGA